MNDTEQKLFIDMTATLARIEERVNKISDTLNMHDFRLRDIESHKNDESKSEFNFKSDMLKLMGKGLLISLIVIGTLTGSAEMISKIFAH